MNGVLEYIKSQIYDLCDYKLTDYAAEVEGTAYDACRFMLNDKVVLSRTAKTTPKKVGLFVTFWQRSEAGPIVPFSDEDKIDFYVVNVQTDDRCGQFVFPKSVLVQKGIMSSTKKKGKLGFRVYPPWDVVSSKQAEISQRWQVNYFYEVTGDQDLARIEQLYTV